ncbi:ABC transporter ATP-binding protein [Flavihumibacter sp.]|uniref:ABC transporter ATP-binding protein n=1 Tax=Flavihumibacter sp. TaxID=1913981 RepID=UPI002FCC385F
MTISLSDAGKRFNREWIFRRLSHRFESGRSYAITGPNGSGKSTLLQVIAGAVAPSAGTVTYSSSAKAIEAENAYLHLSIAAPYLELIEEMTATELLHFHQGFKPLLPTHSISSVLEIVGLEKAAHKQIRYYSSGMKQRIKLAQAIFSETPVLLLDEPCTNLDASGIMLYQQLISEYCKDRLVIVSSNDPQEYGFCGEEIMISDYKK